MLNIKQQVKSIIKRSITYFGYDILIFKKSAYNQFRVCNIVNTMQVVKSLIKLSIKWFGYDILILKKSAYDQFKVHYGSFGHLLYFKELYNLVTDLEGDIVECGIGRGRSLLKLCHLAYYENKGRKIYGFDSFEGFPKSSVEDTSPRNPQEGEWNVATVETIEHQLTEVGRFEPLFIKNNVKLEKGFFEDSLRRFDGESIVFLHLDVDLYKSYKVTLEYFWPKVASGGVVAFDEYKNATEKFPGAAKAIDEFFGSLVTQIRFNKQANRYYIVKP